MTNYAYYHQNHINKGIHFVCIPMIVLTSMNFLREIKIYKFGPILRKYIMRKNVRLNDIVKFMYHMYYFNQSYSSYVVMYFYFEFLEVLSIEWKKYDNKWKRNSIALFLFSWILQFLGHYIEGRRPALTDSIMGAFTDAPLFSIKYLGE